MTDDIREDDGAAARMEAIVAIPDESDERENAEDAGEQADVAESISRVRGGAVCHPITIIRLRPARPTGSNEALAGRPFLLNSVPLVAPGAKGSGFARVAFAARS